MKVIVPREKYEDVFFFDPYEGEYYLLTHVWQKMQQLYGDFSHHECLLRDGELEREWEQYIDFANDLDGIDFKLRFL